MNFHESMPHSSGIFKMNYHKRYIISTKTAAGKKLAFKDEKETSMLNENCISLWLQRGLKGRSRRFLSDDRDIF